MDRPLHHFKGSLYSIRPWPFCISASVLSRACPQLYSLERWKTQLTKSDSVKIGLYSITYLGCWYRGEALTLPQLIRTAKQFGYDGVEIDGKRPHGNPLDWPKARCQELQRLANGEGIEIHAVAANNDFSNPVPEVREAQICFVRELIRMTADTGAKHLRVFLAWWGITLHPKLATYDLAEGYWPIVHDKFSAEEIWG